MKTYWVYILECSDGSYYTGSTSDIEARMSQHNQGIIEGYTSSRRPVKLVFSQDFGYVWDAVAAERQIKGWTRKKKQALINGKYELLIELAKCKNDSSSENYHSSE